MNPEPHPDGRDDAPETELTSEEFTGLKIGHRHERAAGLMAVAKSMEFIARESGFVRGNQVLLQLNQKGGFDCPGCAWPDPDDKRSRFEYCENGAKAVAEETTKKRVTPDFFKAHPIEELGTWSDRDLGGAGRLTHPMLLDAGATHYRAVSWEEALGVVAEELNALESPHEAVFYTSGRTSNEAAFLYQLFVREYGTNNLPDCSNMCHESSGCAMSASIGIGKGTVTLEDFQRADCILIFGQNPGTNHPRMLSSLQDARAHGCEIVSFNPLPEAGLLGFHHPQQPKQMLSKGTQISSHFVPVKINGDIAVLKGMMRVMLDIEEREGGVFDRAFIEEHTHGFQELIGDLKQLDWAQVERASGVSRAQIEEIGALVARSKRVIACWAMGLTQHKNAVATITQVMNLLLLGGHIGREGAGACPVRGHSNVQGDRTMGIYERAKPAFLDALDGEFGIQSPREDGFDVVEAIHAMHDGRAKVFFGMGGNFLSATPDTKYTAQSLRSTKLSVHVSTKLHRGHLVTGERGLILPCLGRTERDSQISGEQCVTVENSMGVVSASRGKLEPASPQLKSEPAIVCDLARAVLGDKSKVAWEDLRDNYDHIRDHIERVVPGFEEFNRRAKSPNGFYLPNAAKERVWNTPNGKANFGVAPIKEWRLEPDQLLMMTIRSHDQYNTTIYGLDDRYRGVYNERRVVFLHADDIASRGLQAGDIVNLHSHFEGETRTAPHFLVVEYAIPKGCAATYFPETNVLVPARSVAEQSSTPTSKSVVITVERAA